MQADTNIKINVKEALHYAIENGFIDIIKYFIEECKMDSNIKIIGKTTLQILKIR